MKKYSIILADPPWKWIPWSGVPEVGDLRTRLHGRGAFRHYNLMDFDAIKALPVKEIAGDNCLLFLWVISPILPTCLEVIKAWGFEYSTVAFTWVKTNKDGSPSMGLGYWTRANAEICLLGKRGSVKRLSRGVRSLIMSPRGEHSHKPDEVRNRIVELVGDLPRIELFARRKVEGWDSIGFDIEGCDIRESLDKLMTVCP